MPVSQWTTDPLHLGTVAVENSILNYQNKARDMYVIGGSEPIIAPDLTLLQQHMKVPELRKLVEQLSSTHSSMMVSQSLIEPFRWKH